MALPTDLSAATLVSAETPIQNLPCMKVAQVGAGPCLDLQCVFLLQSAGPTEHFGGVDRYEAAERLRDFVPPATPAQQGALLREAEAAETGAEGAQDFKRAEGTRVLVEAALLARAGELLLLGGNVIPPMALAKAREVTATFASQASVTNQASATNPAESAPRPPPVHGDQMARGESAATAGAALSTATSTVLTGGEGVAPSSGQPASASQSVGSAEGAASFTAADGISAADRARAEVANDELVELVLGADATRPREMTASLDHVAYHRKNDDHKSTFVQLNNALERAGKGGPPLAVRPNKANSSADTSTGG